MKELLKRKLKRLLCPHEYELQENETLQGKNGNGWYVIYRTYKCKHCGKMKIKKFVY